MHAWAWAMAHSHELFIIIVIFHARPATFGETVSRRSERERERKINTHYANYIFRFVAIFTSELIYGVVEAITIVHIKASNKNTLAIQNVRRRRQRWPESLVNWLTRAGSPPIRFNGVAMSMNTHTSFNLFAYLNFWNFRFFARRNGSHYHAICECEPLATGCITCRIRDWDWVDFKAKLWNQ